MSMEEEKGMYFAAGSRLIAYPALLDCGDVVDSMSAVLLFAAAFYRF